MSASEELTVPGKASSPPEEPPEKSSSLDNLLLLLAGLLFTGSCLLIVGIIPVLIMAVGAFLAIKSGDVKHVKVAARFIQIVVIVGAFVCGVNAAYNQLIADAATIAMEASSESYPTMPDSPVLAEWTYTEAVEQKNDSLIMIGVLFSSALVIEFLWVQPLTRQFPAWRAARALRHLKASAEKGSIIKRDALAPYSVADELLKWNKLRQEGLVTEAQFEEARAKLLDGR